LLSRILSKGGEKLCQLTGIGKVVEDPTVNSNIKTQAPYQT
jgi:hypothetical protein